MDKCGNERVYESVLLRRTYRDGPKVRNETVANLSMLPEAAIAALEATLKGQTLIPAGSEFSKSRSRDGALNHRRHCTVTTASRKTSKHSGSGILKRQVPLA